MTPIWSELGISNDIDGAWRAEAACRGHSELFVPHKGRDKREEHANRVAARAICASCPVFNECLEHITNNYEFEGMYAGMTAHERNRPARRKRLAS